MSQLKVRARTCQKPTTKHPADISTSQGFTIPGMISPVDSYTSGADQSFYPNGLRIAIGTSTLTGMADFAKGPRLGRKKCELQTFDTKPFKTNSPSYALQDKCAASTRRKSVPAKRLPSTCFSQSPPFKGNGLPVHAVDKHSVLVMRPSTTRNPSRLASQTKTSTTPLNVSKSDENALTSLVMNPIHDIKNKLLSKGDESDRSALKMLESEAVKGTSPSYAEAVDFGHLLLKDILRANETMLVRPGVTSQTSHGKSRMSLTTPINDELCEEAISKSNQTRPTLKENVKYKDGKNPSSKDSSDIQTMKRVPSVTQLTKQHLSPKSNHVTLTTLSPNGESPKTRDSLPPDVVSSISLKDNPNQPRVQESSSRKVTRHVKQNASGCLLHTAIRNMEKEGRVHPKVLHPQQVFRELNITKELSDICYQAATDKRYDRWTRTKKNDKKRRVSMSPSHSSDEEDQEAVTAFHNSILHRQQKAIEDAVSRMRKSSRSGTCTDSCKSAPTSYSGNNRCESEPIPESTRSRHHKNRGSSSKTSGLKSGTADAKPKPKTPRKATQKDKRRMDAPPTSPDKLKLRGSHPLTSTERPASLHNARAMKSSRVCDTGDKKTPAKVGSNCKNENDERQNTKKSRGNATLTSKSGRITEPGSRISNNHASSSNTRVLASPTIISLTPMMYNPARTSPFTFSVFELPREHKDSNATMRKKPSVLKKKSKKSK